MPAPELSTGDGAWRILADFTVPSEPGNERWAMERVAEVAQRLGLSHRRLERLKTAVAETTMNAMEHGNNYRPELPVAIQVLESETDLLIRVTDQGSQAGQPADNSRLGIVPNKQHGRQDEHRYGRFSPDRRTDRTFGKGVSCQRSALRSECAKNPELQSSICTARSTLSRRNL